MKIAEMKTYMVSNPPPSLGGPALSLSKRRNSGMFWLDRGPIWNSIWMKSAAAAVNLPQLWMPALKRGEKPAQEPSCFLPMRPYRPA